MSSIYSVPRASSESFEDSMYASEFTENSQSGDESFWKLKKLAQTYVPSAAGPQPTLLTAAVPAGWSKTMDDSLDSCYAIFIRL